VKKRQQLACALGGGIGRHGAVGVGLLTERCVGVRTIDRRRRGEHDALGATAQAGLEQPRGRLQICANVGDGVQDARPHACLGRQVHDDVKWPQIEGPIHVGLVQQIARQEGKPVAARRLHFRKVATLDRRAPVTPDRCATR
jgi:hypothetical protein